MILKMNIEKITDFIIDVKMRFSQLCYFEYLLKTKKEDLNDYILDITNDENLENKEQILENINKELKDIDRILEDIKSGIETFNSQSLSLNLGEDR